MTVATLPRADIHLDPRAWPRLILDAERVAGFAEMYAADPDSLPPLEVVQCTTGYLLADGRHRLDALDRLDVRLVPAVVLDPGDRDPVDVAYERGLVTATTTSKPLTRAERQAAVRRLMDERPELTDRALAQLAGVAHTTVARIRSRDTALDTEVDHLALHGCRTRLAQAEAMIRDGTADPDRLNDLATVAGAELRQAVDATTDLSVCCQLARIAWDWEQLLTIRRIHAERAAGRALLDLRAKYGDAAVTEVIEMAGRIRAADRAGRCYRCGAPSPPDLCCSPCREAVATAIADRLQAVS